MNARPGHADLGADDEELAPQVIEAQRIERPLRVTPRDEQDHTLGVPFAPPDPTLADEDDEDAVQVIELEGTNNLGDRRDSESTSRQTSRRGSAVGRRPGGGGRKDPVAELTTRDYVYYLFDGFPSRLYRKRTLGWVHASEVFNNMMLFVVLVSCFSFAAETLPEYYDRNLLSFNVIEGCCIAIFTVDFIVRVVLVRDKPRFIRSVQNWIDFISIVPYYITLGVGTGNQSAGGFVMLRMLRLMRVFRILKLSKRNVGLQAVVEAMLQSSEAISLLTFLLMIATVLFSSAMFFAEQTGSSFDADRQLWIRDDGQISPFQSIFHTMWWCVVTMTTVGYGDDVPVTPLGKVIGSITMLCGVFVLAFPTVILSTNFQEVHQAKVDQHKQMREELEEIEAEAEKGAEEIEDGDDRRSTDDDDDGIFTVPPPPDVASPVGAEVHKERTLAGMSTKVDPRFEALVEKLQSNYSKYTRFSYSFNPYAMRAAARSMKATSMKRRGSALMFSGGQVTSIAGPSVPNHDGSGSPGGAFGPRRVSVESEGQRSATPLSGPTVAIDVRRPDAATPPAATNDSFGGENVAASFKSLAAAVDKTVTGMVQIVDNEVAVFTPSLYFAATETNHLYVRVEAVPGADQQLATLHLVVDAESCRDVVMESIRKHRPDESFIPVARPIRKLQLKLETTHALLRDVRLVTTVLDNPAGTVPLSLLVPNNSVLSIMLSNLSSLTFAVRSYYDEPAAVVEPLVRYGGVLLTGDAFDNEDDLQLFIVDEDDRQMQERREDLHGEATNARGRRGSNFIAAAAGGTSASGSTSPQLRSNRVSVSAAADSGLGPMLTSGHDARGEMSMSADDSDTKDANNHTGVFSEPSPSTPQLHHEPPPRARRRSSALETPSARRGGAEALPPSASPHATRFSVSETQSFAETGTNPAASVDNAPLEQFEPGAPAVVEQ